MRVFIDTNVILDVALKRAEFFDDSRATLEWCFEHASTTLIAWHSITNAYYVLRRDSGDKDARAFLAGYIDWMEVAPTSTELAKCGLESSGGDFEDVLQALCAAEANADLIVTRNVGDFKDSVVKAVPPAEFLGFNPQS